MSSDPAPGSQARAASTASVPPQQERPQSRLAYERRFWGRGVSWIAGVDEVGRGPLAGPVMAAAVVLAPGTFIDGAIDSKQLDTEDRERLSREILGQARAVAIGAASVREIDFFNILRATTRAMRRALGRLPREPQHVVIDGRPVKGLGWEHDAVVGGDDLVHSVACASIVAKVCRDRLMLRLAERYPGYDWHTNVGYGTRAHLDAIDRLGLTPHHRITFTGQQLDLGI
jgi:ribonuclease HII